ncbi:hypothetical protein [Staphylospora marina]|uniref:hypothetical protein n=1 Tax=Staphylospora marina TaxID=2490858 RepID=UPI000F5B94BD|nr:hypothetical protein [Staphylospora marina]
MKSRSSCHDNHLIQAIRGLIKEELRLLLSAKSRQERDREPAAEVARSTAGDTETLQPPRLAEGFADGPWAVFGTPKPDPNKTGKQPDPPRALPGWSEPYRPDFTGFDSPPLINRHPEKNG